MAPEETYLLHFTVSEETLVCNSGLVVTNANSGEVVFHHVEEKQCKVHNFCQTITVTATDADTSEQRKFHKLSLKHSNNKAIIVRNQ